MKALILSAGFGTRLLPYTKHLPKPLFPIAGKPVLDRCIQNLGRAGCTKVFVNTHHLHEKIEAHVSKSCYDIAVETVFEPEILGTAGAIKKLELHLKDAPFFLVNSDIVTDIDFKKVYAFHLRHTSPVTMVMHDYPRYNCVKIDTKGHVIEFQQIKSENTRPQDKLYAFTGIHVVDPCVMDKIPGEIFFNIIDVYKSLIDSKKNINAYMANHHYWKDIGTPETFTQAAIDATAPPAFKRAFPGKSYKHHDTRILKGDGSDRKWYRLQSGNQTLVLSDHGIKVEKRPGEINAFENVGNLLFKNNIPVPRIYFCDHFSGLAYVEDLGDKNLHSLIHETRNEDKRVDHYRRVIQNLVKLGAIGKKDFVNTARIIKNRYDEGLILEKECRYFVEAFLNGYLGMNIPYRLFENEFKMLAQKAVDHSITGLMHRDMQSRNIMVKNSTFYFIDFQGAMTGPVQYDLASLVMDPYVRLRQKTQDILLNEAVNEYHAVLNMDKNMFIKGYQYCRITRNLQILGAFGFLTRVKNKPWFEQHIPAATGLLEPNILAVSADEFPGLLEISRKIKSLVSDRLSV